VLQSNEKERFLSLVTTPLSTDSSAARTSLKIIIISDDETRRERGRKTTCTYKGKLCSTPTTLGTYVPYEHVWVTLVAKQLQIVQYLVPTVSPETIVVLLYTVQYRIPYTYYREDCFTIRPRRLTRAGYNHQQLLLWPNQPINLKL